MGVGNASESMFADRSPLLIRDRGFTIMEQDDNVLQIYTFPSDLVYIRFNGHNIDGREPLLEIEKPFFPPNGRISKLSVAFKGSNDFILHFDNCQVPYGMINADILPHMIAMSEYALQITYLQTEPESSWGERSAMALSLIRAFSEAL